MSRTCTPPVVEIIVPSTIGQQYLISISFIFKIITILYYFSLHASCTLATTCGLCMFNMDEVKLLNDGGCNQNPVH